MTDVEVLKAREAELMENLNYFLLNYNRLIGIGYRKQVLDGVIEQTEIELKIIGDELQKLKTHF
jgi:hypothetical protein